MNPEDTLHEAQERIGACADPAALKDIEREYVGKKGIVAAMLAEIPKLAPEERKAHGQKANLLKQSILELIADRQKTFETGKLDAARRADGFLFSATHPEKMEKYWDVIPETLDREAKR